MESKLPLHLWLTDPKDQIEVTLNLNDRAPAVVRRKLLLYLALNRLIRRVGRENPPVLYARKRIRTGIV